MRRWWSEWAAAWTRAACLAALAGAAGGLGACDEDGTTPGVGGDGPTACLEVLPSVDPLSLGMTTVGVPVAATVTLTSCGDGPVALSELRLEVGAGRGFALRLEGVPGLAPGTLAIDPAAGDAPVTLQPGAAVMFEVAYVRGEPSGAGDDTATLRVSARGADGAAVAEEALPVSAGTVACPVAAFGIAPGAVVAPGEVVSLDAGASTGNGGVATFAWSVVGPDGEGVALSPNGAVASPTFEATLPGTYDVALDVVDGQGFASCAPATAEVAAVTDDGIRVELRWETPGEPPLFAEGPYSGPDLDVHVMHPLAETEPLAAAVGAASVDLDGDGAADGWFHVPYDLFSFNLRPEWGAPGPADDPELVAQDSDGPGPETAVVTVPEDDVVYRVGVHHFSAHGFDDPTASVRVLVEGEVVHEVSGVVVPEDAFWEVCDVAWPSGDVTVHAADDGESPRLTWDIDPYGGELPQR